MSDREKPKRPVAKSDSDTLVVSSFYILAIGIVWSLISIFFHSFLQTVESKLLVLGLVCAFAAGVFYFRLRSAKSEERSK